MAIACFGLAEHLVVDRRHLREQLLLLARIAQRCCTLRRSTPSRSRQRSVRRYSASSALEHLHVGFVELERLHVRGDRAVDVAELGVAQLRGLDPQLLAEQRIVRLLRASSISDLDHRGELVLRLGQLLEPRRDARVVRAPRAARGSTRRTRCA